MIATPEAAAPLLLGLSVALGGGLLIGLERERRKGRGADRQAAGIRSFTLAALGGALAQALAQPLLVAAGALLVLLLAGVAYWRSQVVSKSRDPGLTTELALFITYLMGVLAVVQPALGAGAAVVVAVLLASRERLHLFATRALSDAELHDALLLAAFALVLLPLLPTAPLPWLAGLRPRTLALLMVLILALQAVGHVALRLFGPRAGLALSGLFSGFVSSTATIAAMGSRARQVSAQAAACEAGAMLSTAATWAQSLLMLAVVAPPAALALLPVAGAGLAVALASGVWRARSGVWQAHSGVWRARSGVWQARSGAPTGDNEPQQPSPHGPLRLREAGAVALLLTGVSLAVSWAQAVFGETGMLAGVALSALADAQSALPALGALHASGQASTATVLLCVLVAISTNALTRIATAFVTGGAGFGLRLALSLMASTGAAWAAAAVFR